MNKHTVVEAILDASDELYSTGRKAEANILTSVARRVAQISTHDWNPDDSATDAGFLGADEYDMQQSENLNDEQGMDDFGDSTGPTTDDFKKYYDKLQTHHEGGDGDEGGESYDGEDYDGEDYDSDEGYGGYEGSEDSDFGGFGAEQKERHPKHRNTDEFARLLDGAGADTEGSFGDY